MPLKGRDSPADGGCPTGTTVKWVCPYCGESSVERCPREDREQRAVAALRSHILTSDGDGHGPQTESPVDSERTLCESVRFLNDGITGEMVSCPACETATGVPLPSQAVVVTAEDQADESTPTRCPECDTRFSVQYAYDTAD